MVAISQMSPLLNVLCRGITATISADLVCVSETSVIITVTMLALAVVALAIALLAHKIRR